MIKCQLNGSYLSISSNVCIRLRLSQTRQIFLKKNKIALCLFIFLLGAFTGFGLACHLGVLVDLPTIGIGKNVSFDL